MMWFYHGVIIPTPHDDASFLQSDWLKKTLYTSVNSMSRNPGIIFLLPAPTMCNDVDKKKKILMTKLELYIRNEKLFLWILSLCKLQRITHKLIHVIFSWAQIGRSAIFGREIEVPDGEIFSRQKNIQV